MCVYVCAWGYTHTHTHTYTHTDTGCYEAEINKMLWKEAPPGKHTLFPVPRCRPQLLFPFQKGNPRPESPAHPGAGPRAGAPVESGSLPSHFPCWFQCDCCWLTDGQAALQDRLAAGLRSCLGCSGSETGFKDPRGLRGPLPRWTGSLGVSAELGKGFLCSSSSSEMTCHLYRGLPARWRGEVGEVIRPEKEGPHEWSRNPRKGEGLPQRLRGVGQQEAHRLAAHPLQQLPTRWCCSLAWPFPLPQYPLLQFYGHCLKPFLAWTHYNSFLAVLSSSSPSF